MVEEGRWGEDGRWERKGDGGDWGRKGERDGAMVEERRCVTERETFVTSLLCSPPGHPFSASL